MLTGSCLCGGVSYEAAGPLRLMARCHCTQCRKASGAEFATNASVGADAFRLLTGEGLLAQYESSPGQLRVFCKRCGSPILKRSADNPSEVRLRLGCLDTEISEQPRAHVFVANKPTWSHIHDDLPQFDAGPK